MNPLALLALGVAAAGGALWLDNLATRIVRPVPRVPDRSVAQAGLEHEDVAIPASGMSLAGWLVRGGDEAADKPLLVFAHGWGASHGTSLRLAEPLARLGYDVLLFDMQGHGLNQAVPYVTVRHLRDDVMAAVAFAEGRFPGRPIVAVGHSFGGAASVLAAAEGASIAALVLIATPSDVLRITAEFLSDKGAPGQLMVVALRPFWWWRVGGSFLPHSPARRLPELEIPVLIIQPENDARVRREHAERLAAAAGVPYHLVPGREHTDVLGDPLTISLVEEFARGTIVRRR